MPRVARLLAALAGATAVTCCNTVSSVQSVAPDAGLRTPFHGSLSLVQTASLRALAATGLGIKSTNWEGDSAWVVVATRGMSAMSDGEIVRIRAVRADSSTTDVWILSMRRMETNVAAPDWTERLLVGVRDELRSLQADSPGDWRVFKEGPVALVDLSIAPGDTTPFHTHDAAVLYVPIALSRTEAQLQGGAWGAAGPESAAALTVGTAATDYVYTNHPITHRVTNVGSSPFRVLEIINFATPVSSNSGPPIPGDLQHSSTWFRQSVLMLASGKSTGWYSGKMPVVLVLPGAGGVTVERDRGNVDGTPMSAPGSWAYVPAGQPYRLRATAAEGVTIICVQVRN